MALFCWVSCPQLFRGTSAHIQGQWVVLLGLSTITRQSHCSFAALETTHPMTQCHNQCDPLPKLNYSKNPLHVMKPEASITLLTSAHHLPLSQPNKSSSSSPLNYFFWRSILILPFQPCVTLLKMLNLYNQEATFPFSTS